MELLFFLVCSVLLFMLLVKLWLACNTIDALYRRIEVLSLDLKDLRREVRAIRGSDTEKTTG